MNEIIKVGLGFDVHQFKKGKKLYLGGVLIPFHSGLEGHSDGDCLIHAICDAILGGIGKEDIGVLFPSSDPLVKDIDSKIILKKVIEIMGKEGWNILNLDSVIIADKPELKNYIEEMKNVISEILGIENHLIGIKAKRGEGVFIDKGIYTIVVCLLRREYEKG